MHSMQDLSLLTCQPKAQKIQWLQQVGAKRRLPKWRMPFGKQQLNQRCIVAMVGDGINDAPVSNLIHTKMSPSPLTTQVQALTAADIGVAIGSGSKHSRIDIPTQLTDWCRRRCDIKRFLYSFVFQSPKSGYFE